MCFCAHWCFIKETIIKTLISKLTILLPVKNLINSNYFAKYGKKYTLDLEIGYHN